MAACPITKTFCDFVIHSPVTATVGAAEVTIDTVDRAIAEGP